MVEFKEMTVNDAAEVAKLYNELVCFIRNETGDEYFNIDTLPEAETEKQLKESLENPALITFVAKDNGNVIAFISGEIRKTPAGIKLKSWLCQRRLFLGIQAEVLMKNWRVYCGLLKGMV